MDIRVNLRHRRATRSAILNTMDTLDRDRQNLGTRLRQARKAAGLSLRQTADRAGMSVPGVYHHYREKQDLLVRALDLTMDELHWRVRAARSDGTNAVERLTHTVEALALFHTRRRGLAFIGASEMRSLTPH